jgi:hypothetical protein
VGVDPEVVELHKHLEEVHHIQPPKALLACQEEACPDVGRCVLLLLAAFHDVIDFDYGYCFGFDHGRHGLLGPGNRREAALYGPRMEVR